MSTHILTSSKINTEEVNGSRGSIGESDVGLMGKFGGRKSGKGGGWAGVSSLFQKLSSGPNHERLRKY